MKRTFTASVWQEGKWYVAQALAVDVASQGTSVEDALTNLEEALQLHFASPVASEPQIHHIEVEVSSD